jgi:hypothetical protein
MYYDLVYAIKYDIVTSALLCSAAIFCSACSSSGLAVSLPSLCCPGPALADMLAHYYSFPKIGGLPG